MADIPQYPEGYHDMGEWVYKTRTLEDYKAQLFRDCTDKWLHKRPSKMEANNLDMWILRHFHHLEHYETQQGKAIRNKSINYDWDWPTQNIFGGYEEFFGKNAKILDLGSGHVNVVSRINQEYQRAGVNAIGIDYRYHHDRPSEKKDNLVGGHFKNLPFSTDSFNRILSVESFPAWLPNDRKTLETYFKEITRVSKNGTIWRGTLPIYDQDISQPVTIGELVKYFCFNGWEFVNMGNYSFAAKLHKL